MSVQKPPTPEKMKKLESLRSRPRRRPDWSDMMKEVESGRKLKHVECNDRSAPIISSTKSKGQVSVEIRGVIVFLEIFPLRFVYNIIQINSRSLNFFMCPLNILMFQTVWFNSKIDTYIYILYIYASCIIK